MSHPPNEGALPILVERLIGHPNAIERQEVRGLRALFDSSVLPTEMRPSREAFEAFGFLFGAPIKDDPLFLRAALPEGWVKRAANRLTFTIADAQGRDRAQVFYKAAHYDRRANMNLFPRFFADVEYRDPEDHTCDSRDVVVDRAGTSPAFVTPWRAWGTPREEGMAADRACAAWLAEHYPDHKDPTAYWDLDLEAP